MPSSFDHPAVPAGTQNPAPRRGGILLAGLGAFVALACLGAIASASGQPWVLGSFGASCVLLFGFAQSPFSQPRSVIGGHLLTSLVGLVFINMFGPGWLPMAAASACACSLMMWTGTVHPPAGSNPVIIFMTHPGWSFLLVPSAAGAGVLVAVAWLYWRLHQPGAWPTRWWR